MYKVLAEIIRIIILAIVWAMNSAKRNRSTSIPMDTLVQELTCPICDASMLSDAHAPMTLACETCHPRTSTICRKCIETHRASTSMPRCPFCNKWYIGGREKTWINQQLWNLGAIVQQRCPHGACAFLGTRSELETHQSSVCAHFQVTCPNEQCTHVTARASMKAHVRKCERTSCPRVVGSDGTMIFGCPFIGSPAQIQAHTCIYTDHCVADIRAIYRRFMDSERMWSKLRADNMALRGGQYTAGAEGG